jgi:peptidoglycan/xylan/chitin deacetylase (PgdA/CDA1 family)
MIKQLIQQRLVNYYAILLYHKIDPALFDEHVSYLKKKFNIISLKLLNKELRKEKPNLPRNALIITFDDGWASNYHLLPILRKHMIQITVFLSAGLIDTNRKLWSTVIRESHPIKNEKLKQIPNKEKNLILQEEFEFTIIDEFRERAILNSGEIHDMLPWTEFQSHGMYHSVLTQCTDEELRNELYESKKLIEMITKKPVYAIAYPYNRVGERERLAALETGYTIGRAGKGKLNNLFQDPLILRSIPLNKGTDLAKLKLILSKARLRTILKPD